MIHPHIWKRYAETQPEAGYTYQECIVCGLRWKRKPCWISTPLGHVDGYYEAKAYPGETWPEAVKVR